MLDETQAQRLRLLGVAGVAAPGLMALVGLGLGLLPHGRIPALGHGFGLPALGMGAVATGVSLGLVSLLYRIHPALERALRESGMKVGLDALDVAGYPVMFAVVTAAAFGEELLFRGGLQPLIGVIPAALLFGFSHGGWRREMFAYAIAASLSGTLFGLAYWWSQNIWVPISAHAFHNILSTVLMGKKLEFKWEGWLPLVRLVPDPLDADEAEAPALPEEPGPVVAQAEGDAAPEAPGGGPARPRRRGVVRGRRMRVMRVQDRSVPRRRCQRLRLARLQRFGKGLRRR